MALTDPAVRAAATDARIQALYQQRPSLPTTKAVEGTGQSGVALCSTPVCNAILVPGSKDRYCRGCLAETKSRSESTGLNSTGSNATSSNRQQQLNSRVFPPQTSEKRVSELVPIRSSSFSSLANALGPLPGQPRPSMAPVAHFNERGELIQSMNPVFPPPSVPSSIPGPFAAPTSVPSPLFYSQPPQMGLPIYNPPINSNSNSTFNPTIQQPSYSNAHYPAFQAIPAQHQLKLCHGGCGALVPLHDSRALCTRCLHSTQVSPATPVLTPGPSFARSYRPYPVPIAVYGAQPPLFVSSPLAPAQNPYPNIPVTYHQQQPLSTSYPSAPPPTSRPVMMGLPHPGNEIPMTPVRVVRSNFPGNPYPTPPPAIAHGGGKSMDDPIRLTDEPPADIQMQDPEPAVVDLDVEMELEYPDSPMSERKPDEDEKRSRASSPQARMESAPAIDTRRFTPPETPPRSVQSVGVSLPPSEQLVRVPGICSSPKCSGLIKPGSSSKRCMSCVMKNWKARMTGDTKVSPVVPASASNDTSSLLPSAMARSAITESTETRPTNHVKVRKSVTWADGYDNDGLDHALGPSTQAQYTSHVASKRVETGQDAMMAESAALAPALTSTSTGDGAQTAVDLKKHHAENVVMAAPDNEDGPAYDLVYLDSTTGVGITGWDSDLSDIFSEQDAASDDGETSSDDEPLANKPRAPPIIIRIPARPAKHVNPLSTIRCTNFSKCSNYLPIGYGYRTCSMCRSDDRDRYRTRRKKEGKSPKFQTVAANQAIFARFLSEAINKGKVVPGAWFCATKGCNRILPSRSEYKLSSCYRCSVAKLDRLLELLPSDSKETEQVATLLAELKLQDPANCSKPKLGELRCQHYDCGMLLHSLSKDPNCLQCRDPQFLIRMAAAMSDAAHAPPTSLVKSAIVLPLPKPPRRSPYPVYQTLQKLISSFHSRFTDFLQAQSMYFHHKSYPETPPPIFNSSFSFDGEYSVVAVDLNPMNRSDKVMELILSTKMLMEQVGGVRLELDKNMPQPVHGGLLTRFSCVLHVEVSSPKLESSTSGSTHMRDMRGQLEIVVIPEDSHYLFPGQRSVVRFRLIG